MNCHLTEEERLRLYTEFMIEDLVEYKKQISRETTELFRSQREVFEDSFCQAAEAVTGYLQWAIAAGQKGKIEYVHFSYLLSGALSDEMLIKIDCYDKRYYRDVESFDCFWDCKRLFVRIDEERNRLEKRLRAEIIRIKSGEISQAGICLTACNYLILKPVLTELIKGEAFQKLISPYFGERTLFLYGAYLDRSEVVHQVGRE